MADDEGVLPPLAKFALLVAPTAVLTGVVASYWPFSAWNLIVPVCFVLLELPVNQALFVSVMLDIFNSLTITIIYTRARKVDYRYGVIFGLYVTIIAVTMAITLKEKLAQFVIDNPTAITNAVTYVPLVIGAQFLIRILIVIRRHRLRVKALREEKARLAAEGVENHGELAPAENMNDKSSEHDHERGYSVNGSHSESGAPHTEAPTHEHAHNHYAEAKGISKYLVAAVEVEAEDSASQPLLAAHEAPADSDDEANLPEEPFMPPVQELKSWHAWMFWLEQQYAPEERIIRLRQANRARRLFITGVFMGLMGAAAGTLASGGGMFFVNIIMNSWGAKVRVALGTGSFMVMFVMFWVSLTFIGRVGMDDDINLYHALIAVPCGMLGALVASRFALRVNDTVLYVVIMLVSFFLFTLASLYNNVTLNP